MEALIILIMIGKSSFMDYFNSHVGIGSSSHDLLCALCIIDCTSCSEAGNISVRYLSGKVSVFSTVSVWEFMVVLSSFLMVSILDVKKSLNCCAMYLDDKCSGSIELKYLDFFRIDV